ncbi:MAG: PadR family transcriptional regulator [Gemmatimonadota bacterium]|nr:MAG: PadR family transcriptional regulator [Gemmatimonadota bacterium]
MTTVDPVERLPLSPPVFQVLLSLCERPMHGYAILTDIQDRTETTVQLGAGTLYAAIRRMYMAGMVEECDPPAGEVVTDTRRRYYRITDHGREIARAEARRVLSLAELASDRRLFVDPAPATPRG